MESTMADPLQSNCEQDSSFAEEEEEVDPRIQGELERLNQSTDDINRWESDLEDCRQRFRAVLVEATVKLDEQVKRIGRAVDDSKPYWEARKVARQAQIEAQKATQEFQRAVEILRAAKETIALAEERLQEEESRQFDSAWQEMLNHATQRVMEAEQARTRSEGEHKKTATHYDTCISHMKQLEKKLKRSINKSRPYFELKAKYYLQLEQLKHQVDNYQAKLVLAKAEYRTALRNLESISEEIHAQRRSLAMETREQGVGAEGDGDEDIANFKRDSDGLSMVSVSIEDSSLSSASEEDTDTSSSSSAKAVPSSPSSSSSSHPSTSFSCNSPFLKNTDAIVSKPPLSPIFNPPSSGGLDLGTLDSECFSGDGSPLLGPRSQCSGASSPDCDQERGNRAEGAEATLEDGVNKLTVTVSEEHNENENDANPEIPSPNEETTTLLLNSV